LVGDSIAELRVTGVNTLKTVVPSPADLAGDRVQEVSVDERIVRIVTSSHLVTVDLQRVGRLAWSELRRVEGPGRPSPSTVRIVVDNGRCLDFVEPTKTKRVSVWITEFAG
jgi:hypothetical protein